LVTRLHVYVGRCSTFGWLDFTRLRLLRLRLHLHYTLILPVCVDPRLVYVYVYVYVHTFTFCYVYVTFTHRFYVTFGPVTFVDFPRLHVYVYVYVAVTGYVWFTWLRLRLHFTVVHTVHTGYAQVYTRYVWLVTVWLHVYALGPVDLRCPFAGCSFLVGLRLHVTRCRFTTHTLRLRYARFTHVRFGLPHVRFGYTLPRLRFTHYGWLRLIYGYGYVGWLRLIPVTFGYAFTVTRSRSFVWLLVTVVTAFTHALVYRLRLITFTVTHTHVYVPVLRYTPVVAVPVYGYVTLHTHTFTTRLLRFTFPVAVWFYGLVTLRLRLLVTFGYVHVYTLHGPRFGYVYGLRLHHVWLRCVVDCLYVPDVTLRLVTLRYVCVGFALRYGILRCYVVGSLHHVYVPDFILVTFPGYVYHVYVTLIWLHFTLDVWLVGWTLPRYGYALHGWVCGLRWLPAHVARLRFTLLPLLHTHGYGWTVAGYGYTFTFGWTLRLRLLRLRLRCVYGLVGWLPHTFRFTTVYRTRLRWLRLPVWFTRLRFAVTFTHGFTFVVVTFPVTFVTVTLIYVTHHHGFPFTVTIYGLLPVTVTHLPLLLRLVYGYIPTFGVTVYTRYVYVYGCSRYTVYVTLPRWLRFRFFTGCGYGYGYVWFTRLRLPLHVPHVPVYRFTHILFTLPFTFGYTFGSRDGYVYVYGWLRLPHVHVYVTFTFTYTVTHHTWIRFDLHTPHHYTFPHTHRLLRLHTHTFTGYVTLRLPVYGTYHTVTGRSLIYTVPLYCVTHVHGFYVYTVGLRLFTHGLHTVTVTFVTLHVWLDVVTLRGYTRLRLRSRWLRWFGCYTLRLPTRLVGWCHTVTFTFTFVRCLPLRLLFTLRLRLLCPHVTHDAGPVYVWLILIYVPTLRSHGCVYVWLRCWTFTFHVLVTLRFPVVDYGYRLLVTFTLHFTFAVYVCCVYVALISFTLRTFTHGWMQFGWFTRCHILHTFVTVTVWFCCYGLRFYTTRLHVPRLHTRLTLDYVWIRFTVVWFPRLFTHTFTFHRLLIYLRSVGYVVTFDLRAFTFTVTFPAYVTGYRFTFTHVPRLRLRYTVTLHVRLGCYVPGLPHVPRYVGFYTFVYYGRCTDTTFDFTAHTVTLLRSRGYGCYVTVTRLRYVWLHIYVTLVTFTLRSHVVVTVYVYDLLLPRWLRFGWSLLIDLRYVPVDFVPLFYVTLPTFTRCCYVTVDFTFTFGYLRFAYTPHTFVYGWLYGSGYVYTRGSHTGYTFATLRLLPVTRLPRTVTGRSRTFCTFTTFYGYTHTRSFTLRSAVTVRLPLRLRYTRLRVWLLLVTRLVTFTFYVTFVVPVYVGLGYIYVTLRTRWVGYVVTLPVYPRSHVYGLVYTFTVGSAHTFGYGCYVVGFAVDLRYVCYVTLLLRSRILFWFTVYVLVVTRLRLRFTVRVYLWLLRWFGCSRYAHHTRLLFYGCWLRSHTFTVPHVHVPTFTVDVYTFTVYLVCYIRLFTVTLRSFPRLDLVTFGYVTFTTVWLLRLHVYARLLHFTVCWFTLRLRLRLRWVVAFYVGYGYVTFTFDLRLRLRYVYVDFADFTLLRLRLRLRLRLIYVYVLRFTVVVDLRLRLLRWLRFDLPVYVGFTTFPRWFCCYVVTFVTGYAFTRYVPGYTRSLVVDLVVPFTGLRCSPFVVVVVWLHRYVYTHVPRLRYARLRFAFCVFVLIYLRCYVVTRLLLRSRLRCWLRCYVCVYVWLGCWFYVADTFTRLPRYVYTTRTTTHGCYAFTFPVPVWLVTVTRLRLVTYILVGWLVVVVVTGYVLRFPTVGCYGYRFTVGYVPRLLRLVTVTRCHTRLRLQFVTVTFTRLLHAGCLVCLRLRVTVTFGYGCTRLLVGSFTSSRLLLPTRLRTFTFGYRLPHRLLRYTFTTFVYVVYARSLLVTRLRLHTRCYVAIYTPTVTAIPDLRPVGYTHVCVGCLRLLVVYVPVALRLICTLPVWLRFGSRSRFTTRLPRSTGLRCYVAVTTFTRLIPVYTFTVAVTLRSRCYVWLRSFYVYGLRFTFDLLRLFGCWLRLRYHTHTHVYFTHVYTLRWLVG